MEGFTVLSTPKTRRYRFVAALAVVATGLIATLPALPPAEASTQEAAGRVAISPGDGVLSATGIATRGPGLGGSDRLTNSLGLLGGNCANTSVGFTPLTDIGAGDLYSGGNTMPAAHAAAAPTVNPISGTIGVAVLGMSNGSQEWESFMVSAAFRNDLNPALRFANGAVAGQTMSSWANPTAKVWDTSLDRIQSDGLSASQVQVVWMKMGSQLPELPGSQSERVEQERQWLLAVLDNAKAKFPNLRQVYLSSRIYAGYGISPSHAEPQTGYDNGLAVRAVVADSVAGNAAVWSAWGPYLWADGLAGRNDGLSWDCTHFESDGIHPSTVGESQVADLLLDFFTSEETACGWFLANPGSCGTGGGSTFTDVPATHTFFADVEWLAAEGITSGCNPPANNLFCPGELVSRGQMAAFLDRALDLPDGPDAFEDDETSIFEANIDALAASGITKGCNPPDNDAFCPDGRLTRAQMAAFLVRAFDLPPGPERFVDDDGSIFEEDIQALANAGITLGCNPPLNDRFCPDSFVTRGQMAAFLHRGEPWM